MNWHVILSLVACNYLINNCAFEQITPVINGKAMDKLVMASVVIQDKLI